MCCSNLFVVALRKATGSRVIKPLKERLYSNGPEYVISHACFECRKSIKQPVTDDVKYFCPECNGQIYEMGRNFTAPKTSDFKQVKKVQGLYAEGFLQENPRHSLKVATFNKKLKLTSSRSAVAP